MDWIESTIFLTSAYPLAQAWLANRSTTLIHALSWTASAWLAWFCVLQAGANSGPPSYIALCLTGCAGIAVLGARRPIVTAWNFVLLALLGVLLLPMAENAILNTPLLDPLRVAFICGTLVVAVLNYLPTRLGIPVLLVGTACAVELLLLMNAQESWPAMKHMNHWLLPAACWIAWLATRRRWQDHAEFDCLWLKFRDRFGLMWSQRIREQFNKAAANAGWPVILRWSGLRKTTREVTLAASEQTAIVTALREMLKRFGPADQR
ncbi:MAG TPA: hypothetical protein VE988_15445 [Gemmataceae bacterium]|nr:hypothetical protein [Gemmataceae bacterium]